LSAQATGDLPEAAVQAQAQQAGSSFAAGRRAEQATVRRQTAEERLTQAREVHTSTVAALDEKVAAARRNPQNYPARWRPVMETQARWVEHLKTASKNAGTPHDAALLAQMAQDVPLLPDELAQRASTRRT
jgi:transposase InsO family protein